MRYRKPYTLLRRENGVWYYRTYNSAGRRTTARSTGAKTKTAAREYCDRLFRRGELVPGAAMSLERYTVDWWVWGRCQYVAEMRSRGRMTRGHADNQRRLLRLHILPYLGHRRIDELTTANIEDWLVTIARTDLSAETVRKCFVCLKHILGEAVRRGELSSNPADHIRALPSDSAQAGILTLAEARALLDPAAWHWVWRGDLKHYSMNLLAAVTGLRRNELLQIRVQHIGPHAIELPRANTKSRQPRVVPIPERVRDLLLSLANAHGSEWLFPGRFNNQPLSGEMVPPQLYRALRRAGVSPAERKLRRITFHSWRHFANTYLQSAGVPAGMLRSIIGHNSERMTDHYTHFDTTHLRPVSEAQEKLLG